MGTDMSSIKIGAVETPNKIQTSIFWQGVIIWSLATVFYFFDNLLNVAPGGMKPQLSQAFNLSAGDLGILSSCYLWSYGIMQIPAGLLMDTVGPRRLLSLAGLSCAFGSMLFTFADTILAACVGRLFIGFGASFAVVGCSKIAAVWFPPRRFALFMGIMVAVGMLGAAFALSAVSKIIDNFGWKQTLLGSTLISLFLSAMLWLIVRDRPRAHVKGVTEVKPTKQVPILKGLAEVVMCRQDWYAAIYAGLMFVPTIAFGALWGTPYLVEAHGFSQEKAGYLSSLVFIGWVFGGPIYGWVSDYIGRRNIPMYFANISTFIVTLWLIYGSGYSFNTLAIGMFLLGFCSSGFLIAFVVTREKNRPEISGTAIGFINMLNTFSGAFFQWFIGWILDNIDNIKRVVTSILGLEYVPSGVIMSEAGNQFTLGDYQKALLCIPVCLFIAFLVLLRVKETYCIVKHEDNT
jgi:sugar phosphate permease